MLKKVLVNIIVDVCRDWLGSMNDLNYHNHCLLWCTQYRLLFLSLLFLCNLCKSFYYMESGEICKENREGKGFDHLKDNKPT